MKGTGNSCGDAQEDFNGRLPVIIKKSQPKYSEEGFRTKLVKVARKAGIKVVYAALLLYYALNSPEITTKDKGIIYGALGYFILPLDFIHDFIPFAGYTDDFAALAWALSKVMRNITPQVKEQARSKVITWFPSDESQSSIFEKVEQGSH